MTNDITINDITINDVIVTLEHDYENSNYESVINLYEGKGRELFENFIIDRIKNLNFFDMVLICYKKMEKYETVFAITSIQLDKLMKIKDMEKSELKERLYFYCLLHAEIAKERKELVNEYMALECMEKLNALNEIYSKRRTYILTRFHKVYVDRIITAVFVLLIFEVIFIKFYSKLMLPLFISIGIIYLYASWQLKDFDIKISTLLIKSLHHFTLPNSMKKIVRVTSKQIVV